MARADMLYYKGADLMMKIANYKPPVKEEDDTQMLTVDTWSRETRVPRFFYHYFKNTFMLPAVTCDPLRP